ncbi:alpha/beta fold hydrolase [Zhongshania sp.]|uniref:alpha/beta fold hydrolase n=1 Tax=Zhongshania sp. TaxID=1971902 RepID=UPI003562A954
MSERKLSRRLRDHSLAVNQRLTSAVDNSFDWLFRRDRLIKSGRTWFELVHDGDPMAVRYYELPDEKDIELVDGSRMDIERQQFAVPLVLVPPLGVTTETFDLMPQRSLVRYMVARGFKVYLIDWGRPNKAHSHFGLSDYADDMFATALAKIRKHSGSEDLSLMGWCMGGLLCLLQQGLAQDPRIRNIVTVASPIDLRGGGIIAGVAQTLNAPAQLVRKYSDFRMSLLKPSLTHSPGWLTTVTFKLTDPIGSVTTYWDLLTRMSDRAFVESHSTTSDYLNNMLLYPGGVVREMAISIGVDNKLAAGKIEIGEKLAELDKIKSSLLAYAGETDVLVPPKIAEKIVDIVASKEKEFRVAPGGHMGVILGANAQSAVWAQSADWLSLRSSVSAA